MLKPRFDLAIIPGKNIHAELLYDGEIMLRMTGSGMDESSNQAEL